MARPQFQLGQQPQGQGGYNPDAFQQMQGPQGPPQGGGSINFGNMGPQFGSNPFSQGAAMSNQPPQQRPTGGQMATGAFAGAMGGLGQVLQEDAAKKQQGNQNAMGLAQQQMGLAQQQLGDRQSAAARVLQSSPAMGDIHPYAQAALRRAMSGGFTQPQFIDDPAGSGRRIMQGGFDMSKLQPVMDQFYGDNALAASAANQEAMRMAVDPYGFKSGTQSAIYGNEANQGNYDDVTKFQQQRQQQYGGFEQQGQDALQRAITQNQEASKGSSIWKKIGGGLLGAAPFIAAPFTGGASLALAGGGGAGMLGKLFGGK